MHLYHAFERRQQVLGEPFSLSRINDTNTNLIPKYTVSSPHSGGLQLAAVWLMFSSLVPIFAIPRRTRQSCCEAPACRRPTPTASSFPSVVRAKSQVLGSLRHEQLTPSTRALSFRIQCLAQLRSTMDFIHRWSLLRAIPVGTQAEERTPRSHSVVCKITGIHIKLHYWRLQHVRGSRTTWMACSEPKPRQRKAAPVVAESLSPLLQLGVQRLDLRVERKTPTTTLLIRYCASESQQW